MAASRIQLKAILPSDFSSIAKLMSVAFADEEYGALTFGPHRNSDAALESRAKSFGQAPKAGETLRNIKAVATLSDGSEEIVGFAGSSYCIGRTGSEDEKKKLGTKESWVEKEGEKTEGEKNPLGPGANIKLFEDSLVKGDEHMARSTEGRDYAKLFTLVVSPEYQRRGIGNMLLKDFLEGADEAGLQAVLGASPLGLGLYKKYGFVEFEVMDFNLWEYEGGEGMGTDRHVMMHRPTVRK